MNEGYQLKLQIKASDKTQEQAAIALGMSRQNLALLFNKTKLDDDFKENVKEKLGILLESTPGLLEEERARYLNAKDELINSLRQTVASQKDVIDMQRLRIAQLEDQVNATPARKSA